MLIIGVTGHRFLAETDKIIAGVDRALHRIKETFPQRPLAVISPLAEGADRLVVQRLLTHPGGRLLVPSPLRQADYLTDFETAESKEEFLHLLERADQTMELPPAESRDKAYEAVGRYILDHCDVLIAIWDGRPAQGQGGTGDIVALARQRGLPLAWVHAGNRKPGTQEPTTLGEEQGKVTFERFPEREPPRSSTGRRNEMTAAPPPSERRVEIRSYFHPTAAWRKRLQRLWRDYQWPVLLAVGLISLGLGYIGFAKSAAASGEDLSRLDLLFLTIQLIVINSGIEPGPVSWELEVARFLIPAVTAYTALAALAVIFSEQLQLVRLWLIRDHVIICGLGRKGFLLASHFREHGKKVVTIEQDDANRLLELCREQGAITLIGDAADPDLLYKAAVHKAKYLISVCGDDGTNAEVAVRAEELAGNRGQRTLTCIIHIVDPQLCELLREREIGTEKISTFRLELFNIFDRGARILLREYPPFADAGIVPDCPPHMVVVGLGGMGESLVIHAARSWWDKHPPADQKLRITVIDREASWKSESLRVRSPQLDQACELLPREMDVHSPDFQRAGFLYDAQGQCDVDIVYICLDDDSLGLHAGLTLHQRMRRYRVPIVIRMAEEAGLATLLHEGRGGGDVFGNLYAFGLFDKACTTDLVLGGTHEVLARAIHDEYVRHQEELGETPETNPTIMPWDKLPERFRESNRRQVDHIGSKLKAIDCGIAPLSDWDAASFQFTPEEIEVMAQMEHERWAEELSLNGWTYAEGPKDAIQKTNPDLVPWEVLPEGEREKNRNAVREMPDFLARAGFQIVRLRETGAE